MKTAKAVIARMKILIVDDMKTMRLMLRRFLTDLGFKRITETSL